MYVVRNKTTGKYWKKLSWGSGFYERSIITADKIFDKKIFLLSHYELRAHSPEATGSVYELRPHYEFVYVSMAVGTPLDPREEVDSPIAVYDTRLGSYLKKKESVFIPVESINKAKIYMTAKNFRRFNSRSRWDTLKIVPIIYLSGGEKYNED